MAVHRGLRRDSAHRRRLRAARRPRIRGYASWHGARRPGQPLRLGAGGAEKQHKRGRDRGNKTAPYGIPLRSEAPRLMFISQNCGLRLPSRAHPVVSVSRPTPTFAARLHVCRECRPMGNLADRSGIGCKSMLERDAKAARRHAQRNLSLIGEKYACHLIGGRRYRHRRRRGGAETLVMPPSPGGDNYRGCFR
jgi:hypothetical protein